MGIGGDDPRTNPFSSARLPNLRALLGGALPVRSSGDPFQPIVHDGAVCVAADARLGIPGRPQSGTGQTALLTGVNAPALFGRHFGPWVPTPLRPMLARDNLLTSAVLAGRTAAFANAHPPHDGRRPAAPPLAARGAGLPFRGARALREGGAVASSIVNDAWRKHLGEKAVPRVSPAEAGRSLARIASGVELTLFAHYDTDLVGHRRDLSLAVVALERVDRFLEGVLRALPDDALLLIASDHGNIEDTSAGHTLNPVPVIAAGPGRDAVAGRVRVLTDVAPTLLDLLGVG